MFKSVSEFIDGKKTYTGLIVLILGTLGIAKYVGIETDIANIVNSGFQFFGALLAFYGNYKAHKQLEE